MSRGVEYVLQSVLPIEDEEVLLGQYDGYTNDPTVPDNSNTPTFATMILRIHNERWEGYFEYNLDSKNSTYSTKNGIYSEGCGLDNVIISWGHDDYMYLVAKENGTTLPPATFKYDLYSKSKVRIDVEKVKPYYLSLIEKDDDGTTAFSYAILAGYLEGVHHLLEKFSVPSYQSDGSGNFPIHVASSEGRVDVIREILQRCPDAIELLGKQGRNILHVAAKNTAIDGHNRCVHALAWDKRVNINLRNHDGMTALDVVEEQMETEVSFPKSHSGLGLTAVVFGLDHGGYNNSYPHEGMATLVTRLSFQIFLISNTIALYSSIIAAVNLFWAQFADTKLVTGALNISVPLLGVSLIMMSVAFMTGVYLVVSDLNWLANIVLAMGSVSLFILLSHALPLFLGTFNYCFANPHG
ncbi:hypothetical protein ACSBR2_030596 [Camellia fascicularis]